MAWADEPLDYGEERHVSPDGRTGLYLALVYDPRDIHESGGYYPPIVWDLHGDKCVLNLGRVLSNCTWRWEGSSVLHLHIRGTGIIIDLPGKTYATNHDGWQPHPLADAQLRVPDLVDPPPAPIVQAVERAKDRFHGPIEAVKTFLSFFFLFIVVPGTIGWILWQQVERWNHAGQARQAAQRITGWVVHCPGDDRLIPMSLDKQGRLTVPRWLSPAPLSPDARVEGLYKSGKVSVRIDGRDVALSRGAKMQGCTAPG